MKGLKAEDRVANSLRRAGASVEQSPGSRGSADIIASFPGKDWFVQVKYSGSGQPAGLSSQEKRNLVLRADRNDGTAVLAQVTPSKIEFSSAKTGAKLKP